MVVENIGLFPAVDLTTCPKIDLPPQNRPPATISLPGVGHRRLFYQSFSTFVVGEHGQVDAGLARGVYWRCRLRSLGAVRSARPVYTGRSKT